MKTRDDTIRLCGELLRKTAGTLRCTWRSGDTVVRTILDGLHRKSTPPPPELEEPSAFLPSEEENTDFFAGNSETTLASKEKTKEWVAFDLPHEGQSTLNVEEDRADIQRGCDPVPVPTPLVKEPDRMPPPRPERNLDNKPWFGMMEEIIRLEDEVARLTPKLPEEARNFAEHIFARLEEILDRNGVVMIDDNECRNFETRLHQAFPARVVKDGVPIAKVLTPGWRVEERVLRRAKVEVPETDAGAAHDTGKMF